MDAQPYIRACVHDVISGHVTISLRAGNMEEAKPRVNGAMIAKFVGRRVTVVGRYVSVRKNHCCCLRKVLQCKCL